MHRMLLYNVLETITDFVKVFKLLQIDDKS